MYTVTIATALSGYTPTLLKGLPDERDTTLHQQLDVDLLAKRRATDIDTNRDNNIKISTGAFGPQLDALTYSGTKTAPFDEARIFDYNLQNSTNFTYACDANGNSVLYPLIYDLTVNVLDIDGNSLIGQPIIKHINLSSGTYTLPEFTANVPRGAYTISKNLKVNRDSIQSFANQYVAALQDPANPCYVSAEQVSLPPALIDGCFISCEECEQALITEYTNRANYVQVQEQAFDYSKLDHLTQNEITEEKERIAVALGEQWDAMIRACNLPCSDGSVPPNTPEDQIVANSVSCTISRTTLLNDMSPLGQYGVASSNTTNSNTNASVSIFNQDNVLYSSKVGGSSALHNSWRNPHNTTYDTTPSSSGQLYTGGHYYNTDGTVSYTIVTRTVTLSDTGDEIYTYNPPLIAEEVPVYQTHDVDASDQFYVEPKFLLNVSDFLASGVWQEQWAESLLMYHPEYEYLRYADETCKITDVSFGATMNSDGFDSYLHSIKTFEEANRLGLLAGFETLSGNDPYFSASVAGFDTSGSLAAKRAIMHESLTDGYNGSDKNVMEFAYATMICNSISGCDLGLGASPTATAIVGKVSSFNNPSDQDQFWNTYKANYITAKQTIQSLFANIYAINNGYYNGCIGEQSTPTTLLTVLADYSDTVYNQTETLITGDANKLCNDPNVAAYRSKEKRFKPSDNLYDSGDDPADVYEDIAKFTNYEYYVETGVCPKARDLEMYLNGYFDDYKSSGIPLTDPSGTPLLDTYDGKYLSPDLFVELGGEHPADAEVSIKNTSINAYKTLQIRFNQNTLDVGNYPITVNLPSTGSFAGTWGTYGGSTGWTITKVKQIYPKYNAATELFEYSIIATVLESPTATTYKEVVLTGSTEARIANCSITTTEGVGEYIGNGDGSTASDCNIRDRFENGILYLLHDLERTNRINNPSVALNGLNVYKDSFIEGFFGPGTAVWIADGLGAYEVQIDGITKLRMEFPEPIDVTTIRSILGIRIWESKNKMGEITQQNINITYRAERPGYKRRSLTAKLLEAYDPSTGTCRLINLLCCGDINDFAIACSECVYEVACVDYLEKEELFEKYMLDILNHSLAKYPADGMYHQLDTTLATAFIEELNLQALLQKYMDQNIATSFSIKPENTAISFIVNGNSTSFNIRFSEFSDMINTGSHVLINNEWNNIFYGWDEVTEFYCYDITPDDATRAYEPWIRQKVTYKNNLNNIVSAEYSQGLGIETYDNSNSTTNYEGLVCSFFEETVAPPFFCNQGETDLTKDFAFHIKSLFNALIRDNVFDISNSKKKITLETYPEYNSFIKDFFVYNSADFYSKRSLIDFHGGAANYRDLNNVYLIWHENRSFFDIHFRYSDIQTFKISLPKKNNFSSSTRISNIEIHWEQGKMTDFEYTFEDNTILSTDQFNGMSLWALNVRGGWNGIPKGYTTVPQYYGGTTYVTFKCDLESLYSDFPVAKSPQTFGNYNKYFLPNEFHLREDLLELYIKEILNAYFVDGLRELTLSTMASKDLNIRDLYRNFILNYHPDHVFSNLSEDVRIIYHPYQPNLINDNNRVQTSGGISSRIYGEYRGLPITQLIIDILFEDDFHDIGEVLDVYLLRNTYLNTIYATIVYKDSFGNIVYGKNIAISNEYRIDSESPKVFSPAAARVIAPDSL